LDAAWKVDNYTHKRKRLMSQVGAKADAYRTQIRRKEVGVGIRKEGKEKRGGNRNGRVTDKSRQPL